VSKRDTPSATPLIILGLVALAVFIGLVYYVRSGPSPKYDPKNPPDVQAQQNGDAVGYTAAVWKEGKLVEEERTAPKGTDIVVASVNDALESITAVQPEARLMETEMEGKNLKLKFTSNFNQTYGTDDERNIMTAVMKAVSLNSDAETVVFETVNGDQIETLGSGDLVGPQSVRVWTGG
jgi:hypothetical protein